MTDLREKIATEISSWDYERDEDARFVADRILALPMVRELLDLRAENEKLRERCTWLQERRAVLRQLLSAKWSKRKEVRRMRAKLGAGPVMPEVPSEDVLRFGATRPFVGGSPIECFYHGFRDALLAEQNGAMAVE